MSYTNPTSSFYPEAPNPNPYPHPSPNPNSTSNLYPSVETNDLPYLVENLFPDSPHSPSAPPESAEDILIRIPGAILHLIDREYSVELAIGDFTIAVLRQDVNVVAVVACVADEIQWPLTRDEAAVKVDDSHYFFAIPGNAQPGSGSGSGSGSESSDDDTKKKGSLRSRFFGKKEKKESKKEKASQLTKKKEKASQPDDNALNYGLTFASKGQENLLRELDDILSNCSSFSVQKVSENATKKGEILDGSLEKEISPMELESEGKKKEMMEERCAAYWTTLAPNVEDYSGTAAKLIAGGSGQLIRGILWCGDVTVERLKWGNEVMRKRMTPGGKVEIDPSTLKRLKRAKKMTKMTEKVATGVLSGVVSVSGFVTSTVANSSAGKKFFGLLPGEVVLASLDGFNKVCDAVEVAGKNVMSTSSTVTTGLVTHRYGDEAGKAASEGLDAAGHAIGTAWAVFKIRKGLNPKNALKASTLAKSAVKAAAAEAKAKASKSK